MRLVAVVAFLFHAPGLWLVHRVRLGPRTWRRNAVAVGLTIGAMAAAYALRPGVAAPIVAWALGHFAWGAVLARRVVSGRGGE